MSERISTLPSELGTIRITDEVVSVIAGLATVEVEGVASMSDGIVSDIAQALGRRNFSKGVKVDIDKEDAAVDLFVIVKYGACIPDIAWEIQGNVKRAIESMTGLKVAGVNVHVQGVNFPLHKGEVEDEGKGEKKGEKDTKSKKH